MLIKVHWSRHPCGGHGGHDPSVTSRKVGSVLIVCEWLFVVSSVYLVVQRFRLVVIADQFLHFFSHRPPEETALWRATNKYLNEVDAMSKMILNVNCRLSANKVLILKSHIGN